MATFKQQFLVLVLEFTRISYCADDNCNVKVTQLLLMEAYTSSSNVTIPCSFTAHGCDPSNCEMLWWRYLAHTHEKVCTPSCTNTDKFVVLQEPSKLHSLQINQLSVEDSAIYFCGVAFTRSRGPTSKQTGNGTVLVIRDSKKYSQGVYIMVAIISALVLYLIALLTISKLFSKPKLKKAGTGDLNGNRNIGGKENREVVCRAIAKEFYKKKKRRKRRPVPGHLENRPKTDKPS
ncbi:immunoglobulin superfamily member 6 [Elgaria multicarinata webbii]|uniref:immunoglobulin superfamily member 6 n=1 Tax=Elgaria multicarinata webbii TaxID=159646 RepID=UPI002FCD4BCD